MMQKALKKLAGIVKDLPEDKKQEVVDFADYLRYQQIEKQGLTSQIIESLKQVRSKKVRFARELLNDL